MSTSKFELQMQKGGLVFWLVTALAALGFYGFIWLVLAIGVILK